MIRLVLKLIVFSLLLWGCTTDQAKPSVESLLLVGDYLFVSKPFQDTCVYGLELPPDIDHINTDFDTLIVRDKNCQVSMLGLQHWGTFSTYAFEGNGVDIEKNLSASVEEDRWIDIGDWPSGEYAGTVRACGNGGTYTLRLE